MIMQASRVQMEHAQVVASAAAEEYTARRDRLLAATPASLGWLDPVDKEPRRREPLLERMSQSFARAFGRYQRAAFTRPQIELLLRNAVDKHSASFSANERSQ
jgi:hypothetical protein